MQMGLQEASNRSIGSVPWGAHFCHFYETKKDLLDILVPYFETGLKNNEFCIWMVSAPLTKKEVRDAIYLAIPGIELYLKRGDIQILLPEELYFKNGNFDPLYAIQAWLQKLDEAVAKGYSGLRLNRINGYHTPGEWKDYSEYEKRLDELIANQKISVLCAYPLEKSSAHEIYDVMHSHQFSDVLRQGIWENLETSALRQARDEITKLNEELEFRVVERITELAEANQELKKEITKCRKVKIDLSHQKEILQKIFDHIPLMICFFDENRQIKLVNRVWDQTLGWSLDEIQAPELDIFAKLYPDPKLRQDVLDFINSAKGEWGNFKTKTKDGRVIDTCWTNVNLSDGTNIGIGQDITERKRVEEALCQQDELLRAMVRHFPNGSINVFDRDFRYLLAEGQGLKQIGLSSEKLTGKRLKDVFPKELVDYSLPFFERAFSGEEVVFELNLSGLVYNIRVAPLHDSNNYIYAILAITQNITEQKRAAERLRHSEKQLAEAQHLAHVGSWNWEFLTDKLVWSDELYRIFGYNPQEFVPTYEAFLACVHPAERDLVKNFVENALKKQMPLNYYVRIIRSDGAVRILHARGDTASDEAGVLVRMFGTAQDVTELKQAEEQLKISNQNLRALAARLHAVREEESLRIAREIHDELGSALTGLKMDILRLDKYLPKDHNEAAHEKFKVMAGQIDETIQKVRNISTELRPAILDDLGLAAAVEWQVKEFQERTDIKCGITSLSEDISLSSNKATAVFRIFQEILTNIARHARATEVNITLKEHGDELILKVWDNGRGVKESDISRTKSLGILGMRERAVLFGGKVEIQGTDGKGTTVTVYIPIE